MAQIYKVQDPTGAVREIEGPEGATDQQIIEQAKILFSTPSASQRDVRLAEPKPKLGVAGQLGAAFLDAAFKTANPGQALPELNRRIESTGYDVGGAITDQAAKVVPPEVAAGAGYVGNLAVQALPMALGGAATRGIAAPELQSGARTLMQSALKPPKSELLKGNAARAIDTMLEEGINVSKGGVTKLRDKINALNVEIAEAIKNSPETINKYAAARELQMLTNKMLRQANPNADIAAIRSAWTEFLNHPLFASQSNIPVQLAQQVKQGTYQSLGSKAYGGELKATDIEAQKTIARGIKNHIANKIPGIDKLNKADSELINAETMAAVRVMMNANRDPGTIAYLASHPLAAASYVMSHSPFFKSLLARGMYSGANTIPQSAGQIAGAAYGANIVGKEPQ